MSLERIDKILSHQGFGSRKEVRSLLHSRAVFVNDKVVLLPDFHVNPNTDTLTVNGESVSLLKNIYIMMNKCKDVVCAKKDARHNTVFSLLDKSYCTPYLNEHLHIVGRLDIDTEGLLLLTTDGALTHYLISPKNHVEKKYFVRLEFPVTKEMRALYTKKIEEGIHIPKEDNDQECDCLPAKIEWTENPLEVFLTITEGKYHQVKRMFRALENSVVHLKRVSFASLNLDDSLPLGKYRNLTENEINQLLDLKS